VVFGEKQEKEADYPAAWALGALQQTDLVRDGHGLSAAVYL